MKTLVFALSFVVAASSSLAQIPNQRSEFQSAKITASEMPEFPESLYRLYRDGGEARIDIGLDVEGKLSEWLVVSYTDRRFADLALEALKKWKFEPGRWQGKPVPVSIPLIFVFEVKGVVISTVGSEMVESWMASHLGGANAYRPCTFRELDRIPIPIRTDAPHYPQALANRGVKGEVTVEFYIDEEGTVRMPFVVDFAQMDLASLAVDAVRQWKFESPTHRGQPVLARVRQLFRFTPSPTIGG